MLGVYRVLAALAAFAGGESGHAAVVWTPLGAGVELTRVTAKVPSIVGDSRIVVLRVDPALRQLVLLTPADAPDGKWRTAKEWARDCGLAVVINAGMYGGKAAAHVGYMESRTRPNRSATNAYQSVAAFDPRQPGGDPLYRIFDLDAPGVSIKAVRLKYASLVQNLRLIKRPGTNQWSQQPKAWSEAALGEDAKGRALFIFCRSPFSMHDLNGELLAAGIGLVAAQHLEGGPPAQLYVKAGSVEFELFGSFETGVKEDDDGLSAWPIPNVLGVRREPAAGKP